MGRHGQARFPLGENISNIHNQLFFASDGADNTMKTPILLLLTATLMTSRADNAAVLAIFEKKCAECHKEDETPTLHAGINLASLLTSQDDVKGIVDRIGREDEAKGRMPKSKGKAGDPGYVAPLSKEEVDELKAWATGQTKPAATAAVAETPTPPKVDTTKPSVPVEPKITSPAAGSTPIPVTRNFIPLREEVKMIAGDMAKQDAAVQPTTRYLTLTNLYNLRDAKGQPTESDDQLEIYRAALGKLLNSISRAGRIVVPTAVDSAKTIYRIDLRDYALTPADWEDHIVKGYPYALRGIDSRSEDDISKYSHSASAYVRADWFAFAASQPPLYHDLLKLPKTEQDLEKQQGVDTVANLQKGRALRAGFRQSGVSQGARLLERHESVNGMYWKSYDFTPLVRLEGHDLFRSPLGPVGAGLTKNKDREFKHDGGEIIFSLPNGLHGYVLATSDGKRLDRAPTEIVQDRKRRDGAIINGISCMACHDQGMKYTLDQPLDKFVDEIGAVALKAGLDRDETRAVQELYTTPEKLHAAVLADEAKYKTALSQATPGYVQAFDPVGRLYNHFKEEIRLETLAAEFGEQDATFLQRLKDTRNADMEIIASQLEAGLGFPRASWLDQFQVIARALGYRVVDYTPIPYAEFTSGAAKAGGNEGKVVLSEGGKLTISTDKADYHTGDLLSVKLKSTEGVFVRLYHLSSEKVLTQIFPNSGRTDNFIKGGESVTLPGPDDKFRFRMKPPFGAEIILAVASPVQFTDTKNLNFAEGEIFKSFGETDFRAAAGRGTKGLEVEVTDGKGQVIGQRAAPTFTARAVFTVGE